MRKIIALALGFVTIASDVGSQQVLGRRDRVFTLSEQVAATGRIGIFTSQGAITITESSGSTVEYRAEKEDRRGDIDDIGFVVVRATDGLTICAVYDDGEECSETGLRRERRWNGRWSERARVNITVSVPRGTALRATSGNGAVSVAAAVREADLSTGNGRVNVSRVTGRVHATTGNGRMTVEDVGGPVKANSGNGDITISAVNGPITATSGNGDIFVGMDRLSGSGDMEFSSGNGRIEVVVPADFSADVEATTGNGRINTDFPITLIGRISASRLRGTIGGGGRKLHMTTGNGSMEIRKRS